MLQRDDVTMQQVAREPTSYPCVIRSYLGQALQANLGETNGCGNEGVGLGGGGRGGTGA